MDGWFSGSVDVRVDGQVGEWTNGGGYIGSGVDGLTAGIDHALLYSLLLNLQVHSLSCQLHATVVRAVLGAWPGGVHTARSQALPQ